MVADSPCLWIVDPVDPWVLFNTTRPVIALSPQPGTWELPCTDTFGCTQVGSVFATSRVDLVFANERDIGEGYVTAIDALGTLELPPGWDPDKIE